MLTNGNNQTHITIWLYMGKLLPVKYNGNRAFAHTKCCSTFNEKILFCNDRLYSMHTC